jgi:hypothetical protein
MNLKISEIVLKPLFENVLMYFRNAIFSHYGRRFSHFEGIDLNVLFYREFLPPLEAKDV